MSLFTIVRRPKLADPALVAALDGWVDAGGAGTIAAETIAGDGEVVTVFDADALVDYRARRPTLHLENGVMTGMDWPELNVRLSPPEPDRRDLLVLAGPEPDYRWHEFRGALLDLADDLSVVECVCLGALPAMVPHTRESPVIMTGPGRRASTADPELITGELAVPAAAVNLLELGLAERGLPTVGFWAQVPHYVGGSYSAGALALVRRVADHLGVRLPTAQLEEQAAAERAHLDEIVAARPEARAYLERLEAAGDALGGAPGEDIASEVERFLRETTGDERNPFE